MCFQSVDGCGLVRIADSDELVSVTAPTTGEPHYLAKLCKLCPDAGEGLQVQVQERDAE